ncbi:uncharacterized protein PFL1_00793 [Pseudozyma flocculosa PF-1]|uniref:uncharacterized protein n=1 Tax=Pseudozyma flocculosa PF-1 TaxID=1277687 RepID=UPI0004561421|nr:uncharacterized protein PFL1_00793 [Pseudozyma flocculosa PF-1]EPQ31458.1 hypothetical protein PFL1_00793 [Pseudozyma flocculosa PF-1]
MTEGRAVTAAASSYPPPLVDLPVEVFHAILYLLPPADIEHLAQSCKLIRYSIYGHHGNGHAQLWAAIFRLHWDPQPLESDDAAAERWTAPLRLIREREAAKRSLDRAEFDETVVVKRYNDVLAALLDAAESRAHDGRNAAWLDSLANGSSHPTPWERWIYPRSRPEHLASWKQAVAMYPQVYTELDSASERSRAKRRKTATEPSVDSEGSSAAASTSPPTAAAQSASTATASSAARPSRRRSLRILKRSLPDCLQSVVDDGAEHDAVAPDTELAAHLHCLHGPRSTFRYGAAARAAARRRVYDAGWTGWENGYGPFHFYRRRDPAARHDGPDDADDDDDGDDDDDSTDSEDINPDPVPIFLEESSDDEALDEGDVESDSSSEIHRAYQRRVVANIDRDLNDFGSEDGHDSDDDDDGGDASFHQTSDAPGSGEGQVPIEFGRDRNGRGRGRPHGDGEGEVNDDDDGNGNDGGDNDDEVDDDDDDEDDDDFDLDGFMDPMGLRELLRGGLVRNHTGCYVRDQADAYHQKLVDEGKREPLPVSDGAEQAQGEGEGEGERLPAATVLCGKRIDWKTVEAIMIVMHANLEEARTMNWGLGLQLPKKTDSTTGATVDPMADKRLLGIPSGWSTSLGDRPGSLADSPNFKPYDWARVEGFWAGSYAFLDYSVFIASNAGFAQHRAALMNWANAKGQPESNGTKAPRNGRAAEAAPVPCLAGVSDSKHRCELCLVLPTLQSTEEAFGDLLQIRMGLLPLPGQTLGTGGEQRPSDEPAEEQCDGRYPPLRFRGMTCVTGSDQTRATIHGTVRPIYGPRRGAPRAGGSGDGSRRIEGIHWSFVHGYEGEDRWQSEAIQPGPPGTRAPMYAIWTDAGHERNSPNGPAAYWRMDERPWKEVRELLADEARQQARERR